MPRRPEHMPWGRCSGCNDLGPLPPFGEGLCFICATDGPPGTHTPTGGALTEDQVAPDPTAGWTELSEEQSEILDLFAELDAANGRRDSRRGWIGLHQEIAAEFEAYSTQGDPGDVFALSIAKLKAAQAEYYREWTTLMRTLGRCLACGQLRGEDGTSRWCGRHRAHYNNWRRAYAKSHRGLLNAQEKRAYDKAKAAGLCTKRCGRKALPGRVLCQECKDGHRKRVDEYNEANCVSIAKRTKTRRQRKYEAGICRDCQKPRLPDNQRCQEHRDKQEAYRLAWKARQQRPLPAAS